MKRLNAIPLLVCLACSGAMAACAAHSAVTITPASRIADARALLHDDLEHIFSDANFAGAQWGVEVVSLDRGEILYERNSGRLSMPASNNKILTASSALIRLGPDYRYVTKVMTDGEVAGETLKGNLVIVGAGDPSTAARFREGDPFWVFKDWAARLKEKGVRILKGDILGDDRAFGDSMLGAGWEWDDLGYGYAAPVSALQFNENLVTLEISPGDTVGSQAAIKQLPLPDYLTVECRVVTAASETEAQIEVARGKESNSIVLRGTVPWKSTPTRQTVAVESPVDYYLRALKQTLAEAGIEVGAAQTRAVREASARPLAVLWTYESPPLAEMLVFSMIANNFLVPSKAAEYVQDAAVERLANFTRREEGSR